MQPWLRGERGRHRPLSRAFRGRGMIKRLLDVGGAATVLLTLSPLLAVAAVGVRLTLGRPVLLRQVRPGYLGRPFTLYKLRTMSETMDAGGRLLPDEKRLTRLGRWLRATSLDELPTFWNVLSGEMSLVGPRPLLLEYLPLYTPEQMRRHEVLPGITGWAQVNGRNALTWERKFELDVWYVDNRTLWLDLRILWMTIFKVIRREGVSQEGHATAERFTASHG